MKQEEKVNKWIEENYKWFKGEVSRNIAKNQMNQYVDELVHEIILSLYKITPAKWVDIENGSGIRAYCLSAASLALRSNTSPFYRLIRREKMQAREFGLPGSESNIFETGETYEPYDESLYQCFQREYANLHWYLKTLVDRYWFQKWNLTDLHNHYGISKRHIVKDLNEAIYIIREKCDCE